MKGSNNPYSDKINWRQMPLLKALVLIQVSLAFFFTIISMLVAFYFFNEKSSSIQNSRKIELIRMMSSNQEKIRLWSSLGMNEALDLALEDLRKIEFIKKIEVKELASSEYENVKKDTHTLLIPENIDRNLPRYLVIKLRPVNSGLTTTLIIPILIFLFILALIYTSIVFISRKFFMPLSLLIRNDIGGTEEAKILDIDASGEMKVLIEKIQESQRDRIRLESEKINFKLATQLAHDIRSPLEVLKSLSDEMEHFPVSTRRRIQLSINRIEEITFNLLRKHKESVGIKQDFKSEELLSLVSSVVTEKLIEFRTYEGIDIKDNFEPSCYGMFSKIDRVSFKGLISNLINNAGEALNSRTGIIKVELFSEYEMNIINITDNGCGITEDAAKRLFAKGFTTKKNGNGLGLYNAKMEIDSAGGSLTFKTEVGKGTTFTIKLPKSEVPAIFVESINAKNYERIIILDDDPAFHEVWAKRLEGLESKIEHINSVEEMFSKYQALHPKILLLSDFELMDKDYDGIDVIVKLNHAAHSILVTARSEELAIQERCLKNCIKLLPKSLVNYVKVLKGLPESSLAQFESASMVGMIAGIKGSTVGVEITSFLGQAKLDQVEGSQGGVGEAYNKNVAADDSTSGAAKIGLNQMSQVVLIDDDKLVHINWSSYCKKNGLPFIGFKSIEEFIASSSSLDKSTRIFIDSNLGDGIKGEIESEKIFRLGFKNLYLATGYQKEDIVKPEWIKEVFSKSPEVLGLIKGC